MHVLDSIETLFFTFIPAGKVQEKLASFIDQGFGRDRRTVANARGKSLQRILN